MTVETGSERIVRRPSFLAAVAALACLGLGAVAVTSRDWPPTPAAREGRSLSDFPVTPTVSDSRVALSDTRNPDGEGPQQIVIASEGRLLVYDFEAASSGLWAEDIPFTQPLLPVEGGLVSVSRGQGVFLDTIGLGAPVELGGAIDVYVEGDGDVWLSRNENGPQYVERLDGVSTPGESNLVGFGAVVHGVADAGLLLGRSLATHVVSIGDDEVIAELPRFTDVLSVRGDVVVGIDERCDARRCSLIVVDAATGRGGTWDLDDFRLPNVPVAELSPDASHLAIWLVDAQRDLALGVIDLRTGSMRRGVEVGSARSSAVISWSRDGTAVFYADPVERGVLREFRPFDDDPSDVVLATGLGRITGIGDRVLPSP